MFIGTEFGVFMTRDAGRHWEKLAPACRRSRSATSRSSAARTTWWQRASGAASSSSMTTRRCASWTTTRCSRRRCCSSRATHTGTSSAGARRTKRGSQGDQLYVADNPPFGAVLTYHLAEGYPDPGGAAPEGGKGSCAKRRRRAFPGWEAVEAERREAPPALKLVIRDATGPSAVSMRRRKRASTASPGTCATATTAPSRQPPNWQGLPPSGLPALPGDYSAELVLLKNGSSERLAGPVRVAVERSSQPALAGAPIEEVGAFWEQYAALAGQVSAARYALEASRRLPTARRRRTDAASPTRGNPSRRFASASMPSSRQSCPRCASGCSRPGRPGVADSASRPTEWRRNAGAAP
jgi:hypothetical protein